MRVSGRKKGHLSSSYGDAGLGVADSVEISVTKKEKAKRCGECSHCTMDNCGVCVRCQDMVRFVGFGSSRTAAWRGFVFTL